MLHDAERATRCRRHAAATPRRAYDIHILLRRQLIRAPLLAG